MKHPAPPAPIRHIPTPGGEGTPYQRLLEEVVADARHMMERIADAARMALQARQDLARTPGEHHAMLEARQQLTRLTPVLGERFPEALRNAMQQSLAPQSEQSTRSLFTVHFDELELMDETQITESVERARARQMLTSAVEGPLADLDALMCSAQGLERVQPEQNPLRPDVFLQALQTVVSQMQVSAAVRSDWMTQMAQALGRELRTLYLAKTETLQRSGIEPAGYALRQTNGEVVFVAPSHAGAPPGFASDNDLSAATPPADSVLTLERLRRLLVGDMSPHTAVSAPPPEGTLDEPFANRFAREFEDSDALPVIDPPPTDFAMTVPAAFEALQEMNQVDHMVQRLGQQQRTPAGSPPHNGGPLSGAHEPGTGLGQALGMEVVALMVENIARDDQLLWPVQQFVRALEPALMQLALSDPRFFSHKDHPARRLLQEITERSLAFNQADSPDFQRFMRTLMTLAGPLSTATVESAQDFDDVLQQLQAHWDQDERARKHERLRAIESLQHAERRHLLAAQISRDIYRLPHITQAPETLSRFLLGPWAQVMAESRLTDTTGQPDPGRYQEVVDALIWSAQPEITRSHTAQLARLLPKLLGKMREGLASIDYPADRTQAVFDWLMQLHQQAFSSGGRSSGAQDAPADAARAAPPLPPVLLHDDGPWVAPAEARESGFMEISQASDPIAEQPRAASAPPFVPIPPHAPGAEPFASAPGDGAPAGSPATALKLGTWVNLRVAGQWERTQLSWIGSQGNLFLFTGAAGKTQSMTSRLLARLLQQGALQVLDEHNVVDGALDAVAQAALRNSVYSQL